MVFAKVGKATAAVVALATLFCPPLACAIGDSGGCVSESTPFGRAIYSGGATDIEATLLKELESEERQLGAFKSLQFRISPTQRDEWRRGVRHRLVNNGPCVAATLKPLDHAVLAGNLEAAEYLLKNGADPTGRTYSNGLTYPRSEPGEVISTLYLRCNHHRWRRSAASDPNTQQRRLQAYALTIERGGNVSLRTRYEDVLSVCTETDVLKLFISKGATPDLLHLDKAIAEAIQTLPGTYTARDRNALDRVALFASFGLRSISRPITKRQLQSTCGPRTIDERFTDVCQTLRQLLGPSPEQ